MKLVPPLAVAPLAARTGMSANAPFPPKEPRRDAVAFASRR